MIYVKDCTLPDELVEQVVGLWSLRSVNRWSAVDRDRCLTCLCAIPILLLGDNGLIDN